MLYLIFPFIILTAVPSSFKTFQRFIVTFISALIGSYLLLLIAVFARKREIKNDLFKFDLNGDGSFSHEESTREMMAAAMRYTNDTGLSLAPFTGIPVTFIYVSILILIFYIHRRGESITSIQNPNA